LEFRKGNLDKLTVIHQKRFMKEKARILVFEDELSAVDCIIKPFITVDFVSRILAHSKPPQTENNYVC